MIGRIATRFRAFAVREADGRSPLYAELARGVAEDAAILAFRAALPVEKQQPNLLFAALRHIGGTPHGWPEALAGHADAIREIMLQPPGSGRQAGGVDASAWRMD